MSLAEVALPRIGVVEGAGELRPQLVNGRTVTADADIDWASELPDG